MERVGDAPVLEAVAQDKGRSALHPTILVEAHPTLATPQRHFEDEIADRLRLLSVQHTLSQCAVGMRPNRMPSRTGDATGVPIQLMVRVRDSPFTQDAACWHPPIELWPITLDGRPLLIHALMTAEKL